MFSKKEYLLGKNHDKMSEEDKMISPSSFLGKILAIPDNIPPEGETVDIYGVEIVVKPNDTVEKLLQENKTLLAQAIAKRIGVDVSTTAFPQLLKDRVVSFIINDDPASEKTYFGPNYLNAMRDIYPELFQE